MIPRFLPRLLPSLPRLFNSRISGVPRILRPYTLYWISTRLFRLHFPVSQPACPAFQLCSSSLSVHICHPHFPRASVITMASASSFPSLSEPTSHLLHHHRQKSKSLHKNLCLDFRLSPFKVLKQIGQGSFGKVWLAEAKNVARNIGGDEASNVMINSENGQPRHHQHFLAVKSISKIEKLGAPNVSAIKSIQNELTSLRQLDPSFPFIAHLRGSFSHDEHELLLLDYASGGDLYQHLSQYGPVGEIRARQYVAELGCALDELHSHQIIFRDLKTENILIDGTGHIKLTDFGLSKVLMIENSVEEEEEDNENDRAFSICGTPFVMSPEMIRKEGVDFRSDWWSLGTVMFEMLTGSPPFYSYLSSPSSASLSSSSSSSEGGNLLLYFHSILYKQIKIPKTLSKECHIVLNLLLQRDSNKRLNNLKDLLDQNWFKRIDGMDYWNVKNKLIEPVFVPPTINQQDLRQQHGNEDVKEGSGYECLINSFNEVSNDFVGF